MFVDPKFQAGFAANERDAKFQHDWMKSQIDSMADPVTGGLFKLGMSVLPSIFSGLSGLGGGGGQAPNASYTNPNTGKFSTYYSSPGAE